MADPTASSKISHHLTDNAGTPLLSSSSSQSGPQTSQSQSQSQALSSLTTAAVTAYDTASRLGLGIPQRILIETVSPGPLILHSYLNSQSSTRARAPTNGREIVEQAREELRPLSGTTKGSSAAGEIEGESVNGVVVNGVEHSKDVEVEGEGREEDGSARQAPPMLVATVVAASAAEAGEARRLAVRLERVGREFQREWVREQEGQSESAPGSGEDG
ncbi:hypothetical protein D0Z07_8298 [Hyphodiscus hymeniophilus]|uniref:Uncharacterized protein n=1 Tax=Hyphodiscus hymeniophilus TaxID=353542 RepID=A0A9P6SLM6_9HELO|nr:hypothetical protein D0Z07_8298 [Hyphodiscus hymeniophilus]